MTSIAYKDDIIAYDSRATSGNIILDNDVEKKIVIDNLVFFLTGVVADKDAFIQYITKEVTPKWALEVSGLCYDIETGDLSDIAVDSTCGKIYKCPVLRDKPYSIGSGSEYALAAMDFGLSAKEAVKYAMTRDSATGGRVRTYKLKR